MGGFTIRMTDVADEAIRRAIVDPLIAYNRAQSGRHDSRPLVLAVEDAHGAVVGGLWGRTAFDWLFVELLFVPESLRGRGLGAELMSRAETEAMARGCHGAWLDTFEFQARGFYERLGYQCFGGLPDYPAGSARYFMRKMLVPWLVDAPSFVGTWRLLSFVTSNGSSGARPYWDGDALGLLIYTSDGRVSAQLYDARRPRLGTPWEQATPSAAQAAFVGMASYYGRYRIDADRSTVTHVIEGSMSPDWIGTELVRGYRFLHPDRVELRVLTSAHGESARDTVLVWERVSR